MGFFKQKALRRIRKAFRSDVFHVERAVALPRLKDTFGDNNIGGLYTYYGLIIWKRRPEQSIAAFQVKCDWRAPAILSFINGLLLLPPSAMIIVAQITGSVKSKL